MKKRTFLITANKSSRCPNPLKAWTPQRPFRDKRLNQEILYQIHNVRFHVQQGCLHIITLSLVFIFVYCFLGASVLKEIQPKVKQLNSHLGWSRPTG